MFRMCVVIGVPSVQASVCRLVVCIGSQGVSISLVSCTTYCHWCVTMS